MGVLRATVLSALTGEGIDAWLAWLDGVAPAHRHDHLHHAHTHAYTVTGT